MFCMKCGTKLADDAVFCFNCGNRLTPEQPVAEAIASSSSVVNESSVNLSNEFKQQAEQTVNQFAPESPAGQFMAEQPINQFAPEQLNMNSASYHQPVFNQPSYRQPTQPVYQQPIAQNQIPLKKGSKATVPAVIFAVLAVLSSVMICVSAFIKGDMGTGFENIAFALCSVLIIVFAVSKSGISSILKGVGLVIVTALHVIFFGVAAFGACFDIFGNAKAGIDYYYAVILLLELVLLYVFMLLNIVRSFMNAKKASSIMLLVGYIAGLLIIAAFVVDVVSELAGLFAFGFIPIDLGLVLMLLADIFAIIARAKKQEEI